MKKKINIETCYSICLNPTIKQAVETKIKIIIHDTSFVFSTKYEKKAACSFSRGLQKLLSYQAPNSPKKMVAACL